MRLKFVVATVLALGFWQLAAGSYIPAKALLAQALLQRAWNRAATAAHGGPGLSAKPWPWADTEAYARLSYPRGAVELIVLAGGSGRTLAFGPGLLLAGAAPGTPGNTIIAGHRDTHFSFLQQVRLGERMSLQTPDGRRFTYIVDEIDVVDSRRASLLVDSPEPRLTLVTCYPFAALDPGGPLRFVVGGRLDHVTVSPSSSRAERPLSITP